MATKIVQQVLADNFIDCSDKQKVSFLLQNGAYKGSKTSIVHKFEFK